MIDIRIICIGKIHKSLEEALCVHYLDAMRPLQSALGIKNITVNEIMHSHKRTVKERLKYEAEEVKKKFLQTPISLVCV